MRVLIEIIIANYYKYKILILTTKFTPHSYLRPTEAKIVELAAEDSWRGASNNLKAIVSAALSHVCETRRWS